MSRAPKRRFSAPWILIALSLTAALAAPAHAQDEKTVVVSFASASATQNGYLHAQIKLKYRFDGCGGAPMLFYALIPGSAEGFEGYWYNGHMYGLKSTWRPAATPAVEAEMHVTFNASPIRVAPLRNPFVGPTSCSSGAQMRTLGKWSDFRTGSMTEEEALKRFDFNVAISKAPMRSDAIESAIRDEIRADSLAKLRAARAAQARKDSIARADSLVKMRAARVEQARKDSIARAGQANATSGTTPRGTTSGATTTAAAAGTAAGGTTATGAGNTASGATTQTSPRSPAEQKAQEQREADARARAVIAQLEAQQAAQAEQTRQIEDATQQVAGVVTGILAERRREQELKDARAFAAYERHRAYEDRMAKLYAALPARPNCTMADTVQSLKIESEVSGAIIGSECRLADSTSAHLYPLQIARKQKVEINASGSFETRLVVYPVGNSANAVFSSPDTGIYVGSKVEGILEPGNYQVALHTRHPGETGTYTLKVENGELSRTRQWALGMYLGPVSGAFTGAYQEPEFGNVGGFRATAGINQAISLVAVWGTADGETSLTYYDFGARVYLGNRKQRFRPMVDVLYGGREMFADKGSIGGAFYNGAGMTYAGGVEWFLDPHIGVEFMYARIGGTLDIDEPQAGMSPTIDFSHGALRLGMMFHR
jgi:hypothetical protein